MINCEYLNKACTYLFLRVSREFTELFNDTYSVNFADVPLRSCVI